MLVSTQDEILWLCYLDRLWKSILLKCIVRFVFACVLLSLLWFSFGSEKQLRRTLDSLSKKAAESAAPALAGKRCPGFDAQLHHVLTPSQNTSSIAPFATLPPSDYEEYMAIFMAGQYYQTYLKT